MVPTVKSPVCALETVTSGAVIVVGWSVDDLSAVPVPESPESDTDAELVTPPNAAEPTVTLIVSVLVAATAIGPGFVQVTTCAAALHVQPVPVPVVNVNPAGSVSVTVIVECVAAVPLFFNEMV